MDNTVTLENIEKSFNDSVDVLADLLNGKADTSEEPLKKADKEPKELDEEPEGEEDEDEDDEEDEKGKGKPGKGEVEKSMSEEPEAEAAMDIEPYLKSLVKGIDKRFNSLAKDLNKKIADLSKSINSVDALVKAQGKLSLASAELQKAMADTVEKIGETPIPSTSLLKKGGERFDDKNNVVESNDLGTKEQILHKAMQLRMAGKLEPIDVTKIEGRLNKGLAIEQRHADLIKTVQ